MNGSWQIGKFYKSTFTTPYGVEIQKYIYCKKLHYGDLIKAITLTIIGENDQIHFIFEDTILMNSGVWIEITRNEFNDMFIKNIHMIQNIFMKNTLKTNKQVEEESIRMAFSFNNMESK